MSYQVTNIQIRLIANARDDIIGYASCTLDIGIGEDGDLYLNDISIKRRHGTGERFIDFPKSWGGGLKHASWKPANRTMYDVLEGPILKALDEMIEGASGGR